MNDTGGIEILEATEYSPELLKDLNKLLQQLDSEVELLTADKLQRLIGNSNNHLLIARENRKIIATTTLVMINTLSQLKARLEDVAEIHDVVVDSDNRGQGLGEALTDYAIKIAQQNNARSIELTSRPNRLAAHRLYVKKGFKKRDTSVFRLDLPPNN